MKNKNQIGCGYCIHEGIDKCEKYNTKINNAKLGCKDYVHFAMPNAKHTVRIKK